VLCENACCVGFCCREGEVPIRVCSLPREEHPRVFLNLRRTHEVLMLISEALGCRVLPESGPQLVPPHMGPYSDKAHG